MFRLLCLAPALLLLTVACSETNVESPTQPPAISVKGQAEVRAAPDRARFTAAVSNEGEEAETTLAANAEQSESLLAALREAGVTTESLRTTGVRLRPVWSSRPENADDDWQPSIAGYRAHNQLEVATTDLTGVGTLLAIAVRGGATDIQGVNFDLQDDASAREQAIRLATERALSEARTLADAAGSSAGRVLALSLDGASSRPPPMQRSAMLVDFVSVPVEAGDVTVTASVSVTMALD